VSQAILTVGVEPRLEIDMRVALCRHDPELPVPQLFRAAFLQDPSAQQRLHIGARKLAPTVTHPQNAVEQFFSPAFADDPGAHHRLDF